MAIFTDEVVVSNTVLVDGSGTTQPVSGTVNVGNTVPVTGPLTDAQLRATPVAITGGTSPTATVSQVVLVANTSTQLLAANPNRVGVVVFVATQPAYIKFGTTASATSFTYKVTANNTLLELMKGYTGRIDILSQNGQTVTVTEF